MKNDKSNLSISIIIPALNEEKNIANTLESIRKNFGSCDEVILIDNGSIDSTVEVASSYGAKTIVKKGYTIAGLRNCGAAIAVGDILLFIDADVCLHESWLDNFIEVYSELPTDQLWITGSRCQTPSEDFINTYWYKVLNFKNSGYINSGHLVTSKLLFDQICGFDKNLATAEDHDFCTRAKSNAAALIHNPRLVAIHNGYPTSIIHFLKRELWHGKSDFRSFKAFTSSKIAIASLLLTTCYFLSLTVSLSIGTIYPFLTTVASIYLFSILFVLFKFPKVKLPGLLVTGGLQQLYFLARSFSWMADKERSKTRRT